MKNISPKNIFFGFWAGYAALLTLIAVAALSQCGAA